MTLSLTFPWALGLSQGNRAFDHSMTELWEGLNIYKSKHAASWSVRDNYFELRISWKALRLLNPINARSCTIIASAGHGSHEFLWVLENAVQPRLTSTKENRRAKAHAAYNRFRLVSFVTHRCLEVWQPRSHVANTHHFWDPWWRTSE